MLSTVPGRMLWAAVVLPVAVWCQNYSHVDSLMTHVLVGYNPKVRPRNDQSQTVTVNISVSLFQITDVDAVRGQISIAAMVVMSWYDDRITWNPADHGNATSILLPEDTVWTPNIICASPAKEIQVIGDSWMNVRYFPDGYTSYTPGGVIDSSCSFDVSYWPFDIQICNVSFIAFGYLETEVDLHIVSEQMFLGSYVQHGEWALLKSSATEELYGGMDYIKFGMHLERRYTFYMMNIVLPIVGIMFLNPMVFLLPCASGERIGYSITVLLSIAVFFTIISDNLPTSSAPMAKIIIFILVGLGSSMLISLAVILNLRVYHRTDDTIPSWATGVVRLTHGTFKTKIKTVDDGEDGEAHKDNMENVARLKSGKAGGVHKPRLAFMTPTHDKVPTVSWKDVSRAVDRILFVTFCVITIVASIICLAVLMSGNR